MLVPDQKPKKLLEGSSGSNQTEIETAESPEGLLLDLSIEGKLAKVGYKTR
jgi:hypothetical protein